MENPRLCAWLSGLLFPPDFKIIDRVPWHRRYEAERTWTLRLRQRYDLFNVSDGAAPVRRPPLTPEHRAKISLAKRRARDELLRAAA